MRVWWEQRLSRLGVFATNDPVIASHLVVQVWVDLKVLQSYRVFYRRRFLLFSCRFGPWSDFFLRFFVLCWSLAFRLGFHIRSSFFFILLRLFRRLLRWCPLLSLSSFGHAFFRRIFLSFLFLFFLGLGIGGLFGYLLFWFVRFRNNLFYSWVWGLRLIAFLRRTSGLLVYRLLLFLWFRSLLGWVFRGCLLLLRLRLFCIYCLSGFLPIGNVMTIKERLFWPEPPLLKVIVIHYGD